MRKTNGNTPEWCSERPVELQAPAEPVAAPAATGPVLQLWDFDQAPDVLRRLVPYGYTGGWIVFAGPGHPAELIDLLIVRCQSGGYSVCSCHPEEGGVVLAVLQQQRT